MRDARYVEGSGTHVTLKEPGASHLAFPVLRAIQRGRQPFVFVGERREPCDGLRIVYRAGYAVALGRLLEQTIPLFDPVLTRPVAAGCRRAASMRLLTASAFRSYSSASVRSACVELGSSTFLQCGGNSPPALTTCLFRPIPFNETNAG